MKYKDTYNEILLNIPAGVKLIAVSKFQPVEVLRDFYRETGHPLFGENRVQEMVAKKGLLPQELEWHFIGHLQTNKVAMLLPHVNMIQSVDSIRLLHEINKEGARLGKIVPVLLEFHIAREPSKYGFDLESALVMLENQLQNPLENISIRGVMGMASFVDDFRQVKLEFRSLRMIFERLRNNYFSDNAEFREVSMGMSGDYRIAIEEGSTMIRIGTRLFGERK